MASQFLKLIPLVNWEKNTYAKQGIIREGNVYYTWGIDNDEDCYVWQWFLRALEALVKENDRLKYLLTKLKHTVKATDSFKGDLYLTQLWRLCWAMTLLQRRLRQLVVLGDEMIDCGCCRDSWAHLVTFLGLLRPGRGANSRGWVWGQMELGGRGLTYNVGLLQ